MIRCLVLAGALLVAVMLPLTASAEPSDRAQGIAEAPASQTSQLLKGPRVICIKAWGKNPTGAYKHEPRNCTLHRRGSFPIAGYNTSSIARMKWKRWNGDRAIGRGKIGISTAGLLNVRVQLKRPRTRCGAEVYSKAKVKFWGKTWMGDFVREKYTIPIDTCLH